ncbi:MAG TPA: hypothetical protein VFG73_02675 [Rhodanobacteraceae bacterium]|nr:hypothetical protein [Rhodanobacteraceae bacterium]
MARWRAYALNRITPDFDWAQPVAHAAPPTVLDGALERPPSFHVDTRAAADSPFALRLDVRGDAISFTHAHGDRPSATPLLDMVGGTPFSGSVTKPGIVGHFGAAGHVGASVVLAHQRFAAPLLDGYNFTVSMPHSGIAALTETSHGAGLEVRASDRFAPRLSWYASYRSRIRMDAFQKYRGIYGKPGDLDIPAQAHVGLGWAMSPSTQWRAGVDRVMYSSTEPFVSASLPRRLLAVLGSGNSPEFRWRDLDIYSATLMHEIDNSSRWSLRYSTGEQPHATSALLDNVLSESAADYAVAASYSVDVGSHAQWHFMANYAPAEFVLGLPGSARMARGDGSRQLEFEMLWTMSF